MKCRSSIRTILAAALAVSAWFASETRATAQFLYPRTFQSYYPQSYYYPQNYQYSYPQTSSYWYEIPPYRTSEGSRADSDYTRNGFPPDYIPQRRATLYPAVPFPRDPNYYLNQSSNQWSNTRDSANSTYTFNVTVPRPDATLLIGGTETTQKGTERTFVSPALVASKRYTYSIEVIWSDSDGKRQDQTTSFSFAPGDAATHLVFPLKGK